MISLKDYVNESVDKNNIVDAKNWAKKQVQKYKGKSKIYTQGEFVVLEYSDYETLEINFKDIPEYVRFKIKSLPSHSKGNASVIQFYNIIDNFMEKFIDSNFGLMYFSADDIKSIGKISSCSIDYLDVQFNEHPKFYDLRELKNCDIDVLEISATFCPHDITINLDGVKANKAHFKGHLDPSKGLANPTYTTITVTGKCKIPEATYNTANVVGLPKNTKISELR